MLILRSFIFNVLFLSWTVGLALVATPIVIIGPRRWVHVAARIWNRGNILLLRRVVGLDYELRGTENLPDHGRFVVASKHQSAWETLVLHVLLHDPVFILKRELLHVPFVGWMMALAGNIGVDRDKGASALRHMIEMAKIRLAEDRPIIIFPEGTRTPPGTTRKLHPGVAMIYESTGVPVIPVALNSGLFWRRRSFVKHPGTVLVEFLPAMPSGLDKRTFLNDLHARINAATDRLIAESGGLPADLAIADAAAHPPVDNGEK